MKTLQSAILGLASVVSHPHASVADQARMDYCTGWAERAQLTMRMRQMGISVTTAIEAAVATDLAMGSPPGQLGIARALIQDAYNRPLEPTDRLAEVSAIEFGERFFAMCVNPQR